jgi:hypothetical protein
MLQPRDLSQPSSRPLTELTLGELRAYREALRNEADRVSYWRRVAHGRIDLLAEQQRSGTTLTHDQLTRALADTGTGRMRAGLMTIEAAEPLPDLPQLDEIWSAHVDPKDAAATEEFLGRLRKAESQLTDYRNACHRRVDEATAELIGRYRENPTRALDLIKGKGGGARG